MRFGDEFVGDGARLRTNMREPDEVEQHATPAGVSAEVAVVLGTQTVQLRQTTGRNVGEVVVFDMVAQIEHPPIQRSVIGPCCLAVGLSEQVMFADEMSGQRMHTHTKDGGGHQVHDSLPASDLEPYDVERHLHNNVDQFPALNRLRRLEPRSNSLQQRSDGQPDHLENWRSE